MTIEVVVDTYCIMPESAKRNLTVLVYCSLSLIALLVYWQVHNFDFITFDDQAYVYENPHVVRGLTMDNVIWAFTTGHASNWHPLTWLSHMLDCQLFGLKPGEMHLVNALLHLANTLLLFTIFRKMTRSVWPCAFVAAAFAIHPMHVESVAWIAERKDVLSTLFLMLTILAYVGYARRPSTSRYLIALVLFAAGLLAKPMLVTLPFLLLLLDYWPLNRLGAQPPVTPSGQGRPAPASMGSAMPYSIVVEKVPFIVLAALSSAVTFMVQRAGGAVADITAFSLRNRVDNALVSYVKYIGRMFWPLDLAIFYPLQFSRLALGQVVMSVLVLLAISILVLWLGRRHRYLPVGWFWFVVTLVPVIGLVQVGMQAMADRYTYIPYIGLFIILAWGLPDLLSRLPHRNAVLGSIMVMVLAAMGILAHRQTGYWKNSVLLFSHALDATEGSYVAYNNRATAYGQLGRWEDAADDYRHALKIRPDIAGIHYDLGFAYGKLGRWQEAIDECNQAIKLKPDRAQAYNNRGAAYGKLGRRQEAAESFRKAIEIDPNYADAHYNLAKELVTQGRHNDAVDEFRTVLRLKPDWPNPMNDLAWLLATHPDIKGRDTGETVLLASRACELIDSNDAAYLDTLAAAYASDGRFSEAVDAADKAVQLADAAGQTRLKEVIQQHLSLYKQDKPFIEPISRSAPDANQPQVGTGHR